MENKALNKLHRGQIQFGDSTFNPIKVSISQFYGIEINDFAVTVAKTALWIAESQMMHETENLLHINLDFLPLKSYTNIVEGNALKLDWNEVVPKEELNYIMGNPPFVGAKYMSKVQKDEAVSVFGKIKLANSIDYVGAWYFKAAEYIKYTNISCAFVSTNSICQGEQATALWKPLFEKYNLVINFAYKTFVWNSEATLKAKVHCIIVGFSNNKNSIKILFDNGKYNKVSNINSYLIDAPTIFIEKHSRPICNVPEISFGNMPVDDGNFIFTEQEKDEFLKIEPNAEPYFKKYIGAYEFLNRTYRWCLWLKDIEPFEIKKLPNVYKRIENVRLFRLGSNAKPTRDKADTPNRFFFISQPETDYLIIPKTSSGKRRYVPIDFMNKDIISSDLVNIVPNADMYDFGILSSNVHNSWVRVVAGRLKSDYRYTGTVVYNSFPWPEPNEKQKLRIEQTAQAILDARSLYPNNSLAELYDETLMPIELRKAHQQNDIAVMEAYGFDWHNMTESDCVAELMKMYQELTSK